MLGEFSLINPKPLPRSDKTQKDKKSRGPSSDGIWSQANQVILKNIEPNPYGLLLVKCDLEKEPTLSQPYGFEKMESRIKILEHFCKAAVITLRQKHRKPFQFAVQVHDEDPKWYCFRFDAPLIQESKLVKGPLIPDPYALGSWGFEKLKERMDEENLPEWKRRIPLVFWRGSTTGKNQITETSIKSLQRYQLCERSLWLPQLLDAKFTKIVQAYDRRSNQAIRKALTNSGLLAPYCHPWHAAMHQWNIDIDGNVNSWGLLWKLLSGSCILRVKSKRVQWYHSKLIPWKHLIPIEDDLQNLFDQIQWCYNHLGKCEEIAFQGKKLALDIIEHLEEDIEVAIDSYNINVSSPSQ